MRRIFTSLVLCALVAAAMAQTTTVRVQGVPRKVNKAVAESMTRAANATTGIDFDKIERWAGTGDCRAALAIKWADGQNDGKTLVWGYRWKSGEKKTGADMVMAVAKADPALYVLAVGGTSFGTTIGGFGYDIDGNRYVTVTTPEVEAYPRNGVVFISSTNNFDNCCATDVDNDAWNSGWYSGYWSYNVAAKTTDNIGYSGTGASGRKLTDGCVDAWVFSSLTGGANSYDGNIDYLPATTDFTNGTFLLNEGSFGHGNADVNFLSADGTWTYRTTTEIGATGCFAAAWGNRYYIMAKQAKDKGATVTGGRITICDANSMHIIKQIADIGTDGGDGRSFCGIDEHRAYVGSTKGIYELDLDNMEITKTVLTTKNTNVEFGNMVRLGDYVYATETGKNLHVINCTDNSLVKTIPAAAYSIVMSKDGQLWVSTATGISRVNTTSLELEPVSLGEGIDAPANSAGSWTPDGLCASLQRNVIYWTSSANWMAQKVYRYDIDKASASLLLDYTSDADSRNIYGAAFRVDPKTDYLYANFVKGWTYTDNIVRKYTADGTLLAEYPMKEAYWFPEVFVFPDTENPVAGSIDDITIDGNTATVDLSTVCTDADNMQAAISKSVEKVTDESVATATVKDGKLVVTGLKEGSTTVTVKFCSNGIATTAKARVNVVTATGIGNTVSNDNVREIARYTVDGKRIAAPQQGVNIVKYSDGTVKKVVVR